VWNYTSIPPVRHHGVVLQGQLYPHSVSFVHMLLCLCLLVHFNNFHGIMKFTTLHFDFHTVKNSNMVTLRNFCSEIVIGVAVCKILKNSHSHRTLRNSDIFVICNGRLSAVGPLT